MQYAALLALTGLMVYLHRRPRSSYVSRAWLANHGYRTGQQGDLP